MKLAEIFDKYATDKSQLGYASVYETLFHHRREQIKTVLEVGIGTLIPGVPSSMVGFGGEGYQPGASLRAWRDYFPNAHIYGMDMQPDTQFQEERITTLFGDSTCRATRKCPVCKGRARWFTCSENKVGPSECPTCGGTGVGTTLPIALDIIIDDGSHDYADQISTLANLFPCLLPSGVYVVEDLTGNEFQENQDKIREIVGDSPFFFVKPKDYAMLVIAKI